jgi:hypothetical protein
MRHKYCFKGRSSAMSRSKVRSWLMDLRGASTTVGLSSMPRARREMAGLRRDA